MSDKTRKRNRLSIEARRRRKDLGFGSVRAFAPVAGLSERSIYDIEAGLRNDYSFETLSMLDDALKWPPGTALGYLNEDEDLGDRVEVKRGNGVWYITITLEAGTGDELPSMRAVEHMGYALLSNARDRYNQIKTEAEAERHETLNRAQAALKAQGLDLDAVLEAIHGDK